MVALNEDAYELQCIEWLKATGWKYLHGGVIAPEGSAPERDTYKDVILVDRVEESLGRINPGVPRDVLRRVRQMLESPGETDVLKANELIHRWFVEGVPMKVREAGEEKTRRISLVDYENPDNNDWLVVNQFSVTGENNTRRPDIVLFCNGIPVVVIELKNPADIDADIGDAFNQLQLYKEQIPRLFYTNALLAIDDGADARMGSLTADTERFLRWRSVDGETRDPYGVFAHGRTMIEGLFTPAHILEMMRFFTIFQQIGGKTAKIVCAYHQFFAVKKAYLRALAASSEGGDGRGGLMWHTQGSGKSIEMACLGGMLATSSTLENPTIVLVTDRNNLDHQLYDTFVAAKALLRQDPELAESRSDLREKIGARPAGGVIFTTIQKFSLEDGEESFPVLTDRRNVFVFTDEAHRSQYGFTAKLDAKTKRFKTGYAQHLRDALPNATFVAFTGTPVASADRDTRQVFGDEIDVYDMIQANEDGATVPIFYESRLVEIDLSDAAREELDDLAEELVEDEEENEQARFKQRWAELEKIVGAKPRLEKIAADIVQHFEDRCKSPELADGKAMIVGMSRHICVDLYDEIVRLRPEWHSDDHRQGVIKIVFHSSASDDEKIRPHAYGSQQKRDLENRFKDPNDSLRLVIVRDMWLTGYDSPPCHTMYVDKPMKGHGLMQAIARVNRVFRDKPGGLVVDYIGIATELKEALGTYTGKGKTSTPVEFMEEALGVFFEKLGIVRDMLNGCSIEGFKEQPFEVIPKVADFVLNQEDGLKRFSDAATALSRAYALVNSQPAAIEHREEVTLYQAIRVMLSKTGNAKKKVTDAERERLIKQALNNGLVPEGIVDIFAAAGLESPNIGLLSDEFLAGLEHMKYKNLAVEALQRLVKGQIKARFKSNVVKNSEYSILLDNALAKYRNRAISTAQLIEELIELAKKMNEQIRAGNSDGLSDQEIAFYDALEQNEAAVREMKHEDLVLLAQELTKKVKANLKVDWNIREQTQAAMRTMVRDLLDRYGYPPDFSAAAVDLIVRQAEVMSEDLLVGASTDGGWAYQVE
jgi:type I restriction enzyme R subunit